MAVVFATQAAQFGKLEVQLSHKLVSVFNIIPLAELHWHTFVVAVVMI